MGVWFASAAHTLVSRVRPGGQDGFTMVELLLALVVLLVGVFGLVLGFDTSRKLSLVSERHATMAHVAQREIERLEGLPYSQLALNPTVSSPTPSNSTDPANPDYHVTTATPLALQYDRTNPSATETIDFDTTAGQVLPVQSWSEGNLSGQIYDFVTWTSDPHCGGGCPASQNYKRLSVAVTMGGGLQPYPEWVSSVIADPNAAPTNGPSGNGNPLTSPGSTCQDDAGNTVPCHNPIDGSAVSYLLHDWSAAGGAPQPPSADHATHPTAGIVSGQTCNLTSTLPGQTAGCPQPDVMDQNPPAGTSVTPVYCYSTDQATCTHGSGAYPGGVILQPTSSGSCTSNAAWSTGLSNTANHFWVSAPLAAATTFTGDGGLSISSQTVGGVSAPITLCVALYDVPPSGGTAGSLANIEGWPPVSLGAGSYTPDSGTWPSTLTTTGFNFNFRGSQGAVTVAAGDRVGVRMWIQDTTSAAVAVLYDHPLYPSQLELNTQ
jgi:prepilin-type N-terminal cleavage/methylation domain-containing protein